MKDIRFENVTKSFPTRSGIPFVAIRDVSLAVAEREFVAVVGPSGSGKTTLMRMAAGLDHPSEGSVRVGGREVTAPGPDRAVVFQQFALFPWKSVRENIAFGLRCKGVPRARQDEIVAHYLKLMSMEGTEDRFPHQLSGGMQQRVAIARSYAIEPDVLLMDEPFGALDAQTRTVMQEELVRLTRREPRTVLFITHAVDEAVYLADRVVVLARDPGRLREIVDIRPTRETEDWESRPIEEVMDLPSFTHLRTHVWRLLRDQIRPDD
jgi:NitT/TauT family transport system ATP-binding protein